MKNLLRRKAINLKDIKQLAFNANKNELKPIVEMLIDYLIENKIGVTLNRNAKGAKNVKRKPKG